MAENEENSADFPWLPLISLVVLGGGVALLLPQITSSRPGGGDPKLVETFNPQSINARLWQGPLGIVIADKETTSDEEKKSKASVINIKNHSIENFQDLLIKKCFPQVQFSPLNREVLIAENSVQCVEDAKRLEVCAVMIPGGPYVEDVERRVRARRAVIEALGEARYVPEKGHELGYICLPWRPLEQNPTATVSSAASLSLV
jgi:hypothetical protein